jgi:hypothetical protein
MDRDRTDADITAMASRSRLLRELDEAEHRRSASMPPPRPPLPGATSVKPRHPKPSAPVGAAACVKGHSVK